MANPIEIVPLADGKIEAAAAAMARAFWDDPLMQYSLPSEVEREQQASALFLNGIRFSRLIGMALASAGEPAGVACGWRIPAPQLSPAREAAAEIESLSTVIGEAAYERFTNLTHYIDEHMERLVPPQSLLLAALGVDTAFQGKGIGGALVRAFMDRATADGQSLCLWTAKEKNVRFYTNLGLKEVGRGIEPASGLRYWILCR